MSYKFLYQNAQIKSRESKLLTQQGVQRLLDASDAKEASRALAELGFGTDGENFDVVFKRAEEENVALLKEMNEGGALDAFLIENDYINLKILLKAYVAGTNAQTFAPNGLFDVEALQTAIETGEVAALPRQMQEIILKTQEGIASGAVFCTKSGKPLNRSNIWADMKRLCNAAGVLAKKVFPHNLRHLFARTFYSLQKDIVRLADVLGHSNINTTRIYTMESGRTHLKQIQKIGRIFVEI